MSIEIPMPVITTVGEEAVVTAWFVAAGGRVEVGQLIAEVQAEKISEEVHAPGAGYAKGLVAINEPIAQGAPICRLEDTEAPAAEETGSEAGTQVAAKPAHARVPASPAARRLAGEMSVDLETVSGTGPGGRITESDVRAAAEAADTPGGAVPLTGLRAVIARNVRRSVAETAQVTVTTVADVTGGLPDRVTARVVRHAAQALADHPALNGTRDGDLFRPAAVAHVAVAVQTDEGLVAPVVHDPASKPVEVVAAEIADLAERARSRKLTAADYEGGTFSVSNLGSYGVDAFTPIIDPPHVAILGVGAIRTVPGFDEAGTVVVRRSMVLSLTFDHAFVDGAPAAEFLADMAQRLGAQVPPSA